MEKTNPNNMEKTFEELVKESMNWDFDFLTVDMKEGIIKLLHQVREATIEECVELINWSNKHIDPFAGEIKITIPMDKIKLTE